MAALRKVSASQGLMLESTSERLCAHGGPHYRSPDKAPARAPRDDPASPANWRSRSPAAFSSASAKPASERLDALFALRDLHWTLRPHPGNHRPEFPRQAGHANGAAATEPSLDDLLWTIAAARCIFGPEMNIQAPPNLSSVDFPRLMDAGINDWGGVSPVTPDIVNPEAPWPEVERLRSGTAASASASWSSACRSIPPMRRISRAGSIQASRPWCASQRCRRLGA